MTRRRWTLAVAAYLAAQLLALLILPALTALVYGDLLPRLMERLG